MYVCEGTNLLENAYVDDPKNVKITLSIIAK